jgi:hypothetical protein
MTRNKIVGLLIAIALLILLPGCEVVCPECPPPTVTVMPPDVTVAAPNVTVEAPDVVVTPQLDCPAPEITLNPKVDIDMPEPEIYLEVQVPEIECPEISVKAWPYSDPRYTEAVLIIAIKNHLSRIGYYRPNQNIDLVVTTYKGNGVWQITVRWQQSNGVASESFVFSEWTDSFVE